MNLMGTSPAATHAHETKTLPKQETDADYSYARLWFARGISTCLVSALPLCDPGRGYCWPQIAPAPGTGPIQMKEERVIHIITQHIILQDRGAAAGSHLGRIVLRSQNINLFYFAWYTER